MAWLGFEVYDALNNTPWRDRMKAIFCTSTCSQTQNKPRFSRGVWLAGAILLSTLMPNALPLTAPWSSAILPVQAAETAEKTAQPQLSPEMRQTLDRYFEALETHHKFMGGVALSQGGQVVYERYLGQARPDGSAIGPRTGMRIGSISKSFTAVMIMQLIESGKLSLKTPLAEFFPQLPQADNITVSDLLNHRSGLANFTNAPEYTTYMTQPQSQAAMLQRIASAALDFPPGSKAAYSNSNYYLLSLILEKSLGVSYAQALEAKIVKPLGLQQTGYARSADQQAGEARSFSRKADQWVLEPETDMSIPLGAGAMVSTPRDLNHFFRALFQGKLLSNDALQEMTALQNGYGRGLFPYTFNEQKGFGHNGGIDGFISTSAYYPAWDLNLTVLSNGLALPLDDISLALLQVYAGQPFAPPDFSQQAQHLSETQAQPLLGTYASAQLALKIRIFWAADQLQAQATGQG
ncbi:MAG: hypothetical protein CVV27_12250, partial [Candidatus Melainabacteria bacterium HGW-Melainabacteria-1]